MCYARYEKPLKNHPLEVAKKFVETYSSSNTAAHDSKQRVQLHKPRHYTSTIDRDHVSVSPTNGIGPTQGQRKPLNSKSLLGSKSLLASKSLL